ncbi:MAG TPA: DUF1499 domain-containing protein [Bdellovibrionota bacterium]|jgi:uncharacterized protein (DUF1499 family)|nr:DUF1499 domain-containing protein [Bdellovibrionota bacterium]
MRGLAVIALLVLAGCGRVIETGVKGGRLAPCPRGPGCVSTEAADPAYRMEPIPLTRVPGQAAMRIVQKLMQLPRTEVLLNRAVAETGESYVQARSKSMILRLTDDLEFHVDPASKLVQFRAVAHWGYLDLGSLRRRMVDLRRQLDGEL